MRIMYLNSFLLIDFRKTLNILSIHKTYSSDQPIEQRLQNKYTQNVESKMPSLVEKFPIPNFRRFSVSIFTINPQRKLLDI